MQKARHGPSQSHEQFVRASIVILEFSCHDERTWTIGSTIPRARVPRCAADPASVEEA